MEKKDKLFEQLKSDHKDWSDEMIWTQVSVMLSSEEAISNQKDATLTEALLKTILEKAKDWLKETLPDLLLKVADFFDDLIARLPEWAKKGIGFVFKCIIRYYAGASGEVIYDEI